MKRTSAAVAQHRRLAEPEFIVVFVEDERHLPTQKPHVDRAVVIGDGRRRLLDIERVAGIDDGDVRHAAENRYVLGCLVARAIAGGEPR